GCERLLLGRIVRPCARAQSKHGVVSDFDRLGGIAHAENGRDRSKNFITISRRIFWKIDKDGRLIEKPATVNTVSTGQQFRAGRDRFLNLLVYAVENMFHGQRRDLSRVIERVANL